MSPPIAMTMRRQMANPNPVPPYFRLVLWSACVKTSKIVDSFRPGSDPGVLDRHIDKPRIGRTRFDGDADKSALGEFQRVVDEVAE